MDEHLQQLFDLRGKVAIVTGASSGLGVGLARGLAKGGADLVLAARRPEMLDEVKAELAPYGVRVVNQPTDLTDEAQLTRLFERTVEEFGRVDILVNNAGFTDRSAQRTDGSSLKRLRAMIELDFVSVYLASQLAVRQMLTQEERGTIVNITSILGKVGSEFRASGYHAMKAAVDSLTRVMAMEFAREGIRVNAIAPAYMGGTEMMDQVYASSPETKVYTEERMLLGRLGHPNDLEGVILLLASKAGAYMTGTTVYVDGGWTAGGGFHQRPPVWESELGKQDPQLGPLMPSEERDVMGRLVSLDEPARRIVSLVPSLTELFFAWERGDAVVGRTNFCVEPAGQVESVPKVGGTKNLKVDAILGLNPDLVVGSVEENTRDDIEALLAAGAPVYLTLPTTVADAVAMLAPLGRLLGAVEQAAALARATEREIEHVRPATEVTVFCPIWRDPYMTCGPGTYVHDLLRACGGRSLFDDLEGRYPVVEIAEVARRDPEVILLPDEPFPFADKHLLDWQPYREQMRAFRAGRVHFIDGKLVTWYGPRMPHAIRQVASLLRPQEQDYS